MTEDEMFEKMWRAYESVRSEVCYHPSMKAALDSIKPEIERLQRYEKLVKFIVNDYHELSHDKAKWQRDDWKKRCKEQIEKDWLVDAIDEIKENLAIDDDLDF